MKIAYLLSIHPMLSTSFITNEILFLRRKGFVVDVASMNEPDHAKAGLAEFEQEEYENTYYIKNHGLAGFIQAMIYVFIKYPAKFFRTFLYALKLARQSGSSHLKYIFYFMEAVMLTKWLNKKNHDHVHVHFLGNASTVALIATKYFKKTFSVMVHGPSPFYNVDKFLVAEKIKEAKFIFCIGYYAQSQLMRLVNKNEWNKIKITRLGVDINRFNVLGKVNISDEFNILYVGRLCKDKAPTILIEMMLDITHEAKLTIIGQGELYEGMGSQIKEYGLETRIDLVGGVNQDKILDYYKRADLFILPSFAEGIPVVLMEAMAMGIPCVTTYIAGHHELIDSGVDGILISPSNTKELCNVVNNLIQDKKTGVRIAENARKKIEMKFNSKINFEHMAECFEKALLR